MFSATQEYYPVSAPTSVPTCSYNRLHGISPTHKSPAVRLNIKIEDKVIDSGRSNVVPSLLVTAHTNTG